MMIFGKEISFASSDHAVIFLLLIPIITLVIYGMVRRAKIMRILAQAGTMRSLLKHISFARIALKGICIVIGTLGIMIALLRPGWDKKDEQHHHKGRDFLIALDISRSMLAADLAPDRLSVAKHKIKRLARYFPTDRFSLMLFAESTFVVCPFTSDHDTIEMFIDQVDDQTTSASGTSLEQVMRDALDLFNKVPDRKQKIVVVVTDGEDFSDSLSSIKQAVLRGGVHIFTLGIGTTQGAPIPLIDEKGKRSGYIKDEKGAVVISRLDQPLLQRLVDQTGGAYIPLTHSDDRDIAALVDLLNTFEKQDIDTIDRSIVHEKYYYAAAIGLLALLIEWLL